MAKVYGLTQIELKSANGARVTVKPQRGSATKEGARWRRSGMRAGFQGFTCISPTRKYVDDYEDGFKEGAEWFEKFRRSNMKQEVQYRVGDQVTMRDDVATMIGVVERVVDTRPDSMGSVQQVTVRWSNRWESAKMYSARQLRPVAEHPVVKKAKDLVASHRFNREIGDFVAAANAGDDAIMMANELTKKHTAHESFYVMLDTSIKSSYRPTLRTDTDVELVALAWIFDYVMESRGLDIRAFQGHQGV